MISPETKPEAATEELRGREAVPLEPAMKTQIELFWRLTPPAIQAQVSYKSIDYLFSLYFSEKPNDRKGKEILDVLAARYVKKYDNDTFNVFADYCNLHADDDGDENGQTFIDRVNENQLTEDDFAQMMNFFIEKGGPFFDTKNEAEIKNFIKEYINQESSEAK